MRHTFRAPLGILLVIVGCQTALAETSARRWWPFGGNEEPAPTSAPATTAAPQFTPSPTTTLPPSAAITPIGPSDSTPVAAPPVTNHAQVPATQLPQTRKDADRPPIIESPFAGFKWPTMKMPQLGRSKTNSPQQQLGATSPSAAGQPNSWVEKQPEPPRASPTQMVANGAHRVAEGTRSAWRKTVDLVTPGEPTPTTPPRFAEQEPRRPLWDRMFGPKEPEPQGAQTIPQWMAQDRVDP